MTPEIMFRHRFCVSLDQNRESYRRSPGYEIVDEQDKPDPNGDYVRFPSGKIRPIGWCCENPLEPCPHNTIMHNTIDKDVVLKKVDELIVQGRR